MRRQQSGQQSGQSPQPINQSLNQLFNRLLLSRQPAPRTQAQGPRGVQAHSPKKPWGPQQEAKGTAVPPRCALNTQPSHSEANLPAGSSSCGGRSRRSGRWNCAASVQHMQSCCRSPARPHLHRAAKVAPGVRVLGGAVEALCVACPALLAPVPARAAAGAEELRDALELGVHPAAAAGHVILKVDVCRGEAGRQEASKAGRVSAGTGGRRW